MSKASDAWGDIAKNYATSTEERTRDATRELVKITDEISPFGASGVTVFENGCGTGALTRAIKEAHPNVSLLAADLSAGMVEHVKDMAQENNWQHFRTDVLDANDLSKLPSDSFTHSMTSFVLPLIPTPEKAAAELYRVTKPDGVAAIANWAQKKFCWYPTWERACRKLDKDYVMPDLMDPYWCDPEKMEEGIREAGFRDVEVRVKSYPWKFESLDLPEAFLWEGGNPVVEKGLIGPAKERGWKREELRPHLIEAFKEFFADGEGGYAADVKVALITARK